MFIGLLSAISASLYVVIVATLALTATFARRETLRSEARSTLAVLMLVREAERVPGLPPGQGRQGPVSDGSVPH
ncbi:hypothetical protein [Streptomyces sp. UNOB3_S3]|uniref:hypothetical protein n=1 Tax=Streptomyces sp. UNOB3_S3 TaxID=2871682 RepID=UPI001E4E0594|nr:hypothetical protein [Streptomyces sp. UNOB3_S3]MCC3773377.1 hypothetical protein [Streptomyces sp. UNOB3_S3]